MVKLRIGFAHDEIRYYIAGDVSGYQFKFATEVEISKIQYDDWIRVNEEYARVQREMMFLYHSQDNE